jgi:hypothetical protein
MEKLEMELKRLQELNIIVPVEKATEWVAPIVCVMKSNSELRMCCDYTELNKCIIRPYFPISKVELTLAKLQGAKIFSKIDLNKGFYQIKLDESSQLLTTFITPFGRFMFKRLPFGISCGPEYFVSKVSQVLKGMKNVIHHVDDILVYHSSVKGHMDKTSSIQA